MDNVCWRIFKQILVGNDVVLKLSNLFIVEVSGLLIEHLIFNIIWFLLSKQIEKSILSFNVIKCSFHCPLPTTYLEKLLFLFFLIIATLNIQHIWLVIAFVNCQPWQLYICLWQRIYSEGYGFPFHENNNIEYWNELI